jgi:hypothetical protein
MERSWNIQCGRLTLICRVDHYIRGFLLLIFRHGGSSFCFHSHSVYSNQLVFSHHNFIQFPCNVEFLWSNQHNQTEHTRRERDLFSRQITHGGDMCTSSVLGSSLEKDFLWLCQEWVNSHIHSLLLYIWLRTELFQHHGENESHFCHPNDPHFWSGSQS